MNEIEVIASDDPAGEAADQLRRGIGDALARGDRASIAISGGTTPWRALQRLDPADLEWSAVDVYQVDERIVPPDDADRNLRLLEEALLSRVPAIAHPMPVDEIDVDRAARGYADALPAAIDVVQLGLGIDGHTASLVPGDPVLAELGDVGVTGSYRGHRRMTLTYPAINRARRIVWIVTGGAKRIALAQLLAGTFDIPANHIARHNAVIVADRAALGRS